jgi:hypothetical protein
MYPLIPPEMISGTAEMVILSVTLLAAMLNVILTARA